VLYDYLTANARVPSWVSDELEASYLRQVARSALVATTRDTVLTVLSGAGIQAMLLKGAALVETVYDDPATRDMGDLDVLVAPSDFLRASDALTASGFTLQHPEGDPCKRAKLLASGWHHDAPMLASDGLLPVELHRQIVNHLDVGLTLDPTELLARGRVSALAARHLIPAAEDLLLHTCLHFAHGREIRSEGALAEVRDMAAVITREALDWDRFVVDARRYGAAGRVYLALFTLDQLGFAPPPPPMAALRPARFDHRIGRRYVSQRVLADTVRVPVADWAPSLLGVRTALWWSRRNLASRAGLPAEASLPLLSRSKALIRVFGHVLRRPHTVLVDTRISRWIDEVT
jgi:hypothetical protein